MDKIFSWKVLVSFCAIFIVSWVALQTVQSMRLQEEAQVYASQIFDWEWPGECRSQATFTEANIIKKSDNDAVIKVSGKQIITALQAAESLDNSPQRSETVDCAATLTLYKKSGNWVLGRVEL